MSDFKNVSDKRKEFKEPVSLGGLVLFYHPKNFHSLNILFILHEKNIDFTHYALDLANGEQYSTWFLNKNPKGDVPVLQDNDLIIPDSQNIINYLEKKFSGEKYPRLIPTDTKSIEYNKSVMYENILSNLPIGALSLGSFIHEDLNLNPKPPFVGVIRKSCVENNEKVFEILKKSANQALDYQKHILLQKLDRQEKRKELVYSRVQFQYVLDKFENVLLYFEKELSENPEKEWLLSSEFHAVDISLGLVLYRLYNLGFENYFWSDQKLPNLEQYFKRFQKRHVFKKLMPTNVGLLTYMWMNTPTQYKLGAGAIGMAICAAIVHK